MKIIEVTPKSNWILSVVADDGRIGLFDVGPYLEFEAFAPLRDQEEFLKIQNGGYFVEWECGADLSADTFEGRWEIVKQTIPDNDYANTPTKGNTAPSLSPQS